MIVEPVTLAPDALVGDALELMARYHISGVPITDADGVLVGILTNRDLRFGVPSTTRRSRELMTSENLVTAPVGTTLEEARGDPRPAPDREAADRRRRRPAQGPDHRQGHPEARARTRTRRRTSAAACGSAPPSASAPTRSSAPRRSSTRRSTCSSSTPRTATRAASSRWCAASRTRSTSRSIAGNIATGEAAEALIDAGADAVKVGVGPGLDLHDARRRRRRRAAGHRDLRLRRRSRPSTACR